MPTIRRACLAMCSGCCPAGARAVVAEFHPQGPCEQGAPREFRLAPEQVQAWCEAAGFNVLDFRRQSPEHYMFAVERAA